MGVAQRVRQLACLALALAASAPRVARAQERSRLVPEFVAGVHLTYPLGVTGMFGLAWLSRGDLGQGPFVSWEPTQSGQKGSLGWYVKDGGTLSVAASAVRTGSSVRGVDARASYVGAEVRVGFIATLTLGAYARTGSTGNSPWMVLGGLGIQF